MATHESRGDSFQEAPGRSFSDCLAAALRFLSYRPRTIQEVKRRMEKKFASETVEQTLAYLLEHRFLDDEAFSLQWIQSRERRRPKGSLALRQELRRLGIDQTIIEASLEGIDEATNACNAGRKLAARLAAQRASYQEFRRKVGSYLQRRGFAFDTVFEAVATLWEEFAEDD